MDHDDLPVGRVLTRRDAMHLLTAAGATLLTGTASYKESTSKLPSCVVKPEMTEGPYFADKRQMRSDIRLEPSTDTLTPGLPVVLQFNVTQVSNGSCTPLPGAIVDIWQCDALGRYSAFNDRRRGHDVSDQSFLRGYQITDADGVATFTTIFPGWYPGRAVHIHFKIRKETSPERTYEFTSQLFFEEDLTDNVHAMAPYAAQGKRDTVNARDGIYRRNGGEQLLLSGEPKENGFRTFFSIGLDLSDAEAGRPDGRGFRRRRNP